MRPPSPAAGWSAARVTAVDSQACRDSRRTGTASARLPDTCQVTCSPPIRFGARCGLPTQLRQDGPQWKDPEGSTIQMRLLVSSAQGANGGGYGAILAFDYVGNAWELSVTTAASLTREDCASIQAATCSM